MHANVFNKSLAHISNNCLTNYWLTGQTDRQTD